MPEIGLSLPTHAPDIQPNTALDLARRAEAAGVHSIWTLDRLVFDNHEPLVTMGALAVATSRVKIGTAILLATLRPPTLLAKMIATLDELSGGRIVLGLGSGSRADDFAGAEAPFEHRGSRLEELVTVLKRVWSGEPVVHDGRFYQLDVGPIGPRPVQRPHPPIWIGGFAEPVLRRVARIADGYIATSTAGLTGFKENWAKIRRYAEQEGRDPASITPAVLVHTCVDDDRERAAAAMVKHFARYYGPRRALSPWDMAGSPEECVRLAHDFFDAGVETLIILPVTADPDHFDRVCQEVVPRLLKAS